MTWDWEIKVEPEKFSDKELENRLVCNGASLQYVPKERQTNRLCLLAIKNFPLAIRFVSNQEYNLCLEAVKNKGISLQYVEKQTYELCRLAVLNDPRALKYIDKSKFAEYPSAFALSGGFADKEFSSIKSSIAREGIKAGHYSLFKELENPGINDLCLEVVKKNGLALEHVKDQTHEICLEAVKQNGWALKFVKRQTHEICLEAVKQEGPVLRHVLNQTHEICLEAVKQEGKALEYVKEQTYEICLAAVKQNRVAFRKVKEEYRRMSLLIQCELSFIINPRLIKWWV